MEVFMGIIKKTIYGLLLTSSFVVFADTRPWPGGLPCSKVFENQPKYFKELADLARFSPKRVHVERFKELFQRTDLSQLDKPMLFHLLLKAAESDNAEVLTLILNNGGREIINHNDRGFGYRQGTVLLRAAEHGSVNSIKVLVENGADINILNPHYNSSVFHKLALATDQPWYLPVNAKNIQEAFKFLLKKDSTHLNTRDNRGFTPLDYIKTKRSFLLLASYGGRSGEDNLSLKELLAEVLKHQFDNGWKKFSAP